MKGPSGLPELAVTAVDCAHQAFCLRAAPAESPVGRAAAPRRPTVPRRSNNLSLDRLWGGRYAFLPEAKAPIQGAELSPELPPDLLPRGGI
jgi:hypothetical protein